MSLVLFAAASLMRAQSNAENVVALVGGRVISSPEATPVDDTTVVLADGRILDVGPKGRVKIPSGAQTVDCAGLTIVAGFQNNHVHFTEETWANAKTRPAALLTSGLEAVLGADPSQGLKAFVDVRYTIRGARMLYEGR